MPAQFELLSWNVHKQRDRGFADELVRFSEGVELLALQEAIATPPAWALTEGRRSWSLVVAFELGREQVATGVATASVVAPMREQALHTPGREPLTRTPKSMLLSYVAIATSAAPLLLVNLHGLNFRPARALDAQLRALDPIVGAHAGPLLVVGDFNTWSGARRSVVAAFVERHRLESAFAPDADPRLDHVYVRGLSVRGAEVLDARSSDHDALRVELAAP